MSLIGTNSTAWAASTTRTPMSPSDEMVSAERGSSAAGTGSSASDTSAVMPSGILPSGLAISTSTR